jgi:hypothetical protein
MFLNVIDCHERTDKAMKNEKFWKYIARLFVMYRWFISYLYPISAFGDQQIFFSNFLGRNNFSESRSRNSGRTRHGRIDVDSCQGKSDQKKFFKIGICIGFEANFWNEILESNSNDKNLGTSFQKI